jgi:uncharacterized protein
MLTLDDTPASYLIRGYAPDELRIAGRSIRRSCLLCADRVVEPWDVSGIESLTLADLEPIFAQGQAIVLLAAGAGLQHPAPRIRAAFGERRIGLEVMEFGAACRTFNVLVQEGRPVLGAFILARGTSGGGKPEEDTGRESFTNQPTDRS